MGLISRVSSRTYRFTPSPHLIMKLTYSAALLAVLATSYVIKAQEDAEDVEAEVLIEDDDVDAEEEADTPEAEAQPQLMPMPLTGVKSFFVLSRWSPYYHWRQTFRCSCWCSE